SSRRCTLTRRRRRRSGPAPRCRTTRRTSTAPLTGRPCAPPPRSEREERAIMTTTTTIKKNRGIAAAAALAFAAALALAPSSPRAQCYDGVGPADSSYWSNMGGCWPEYFNWQYQAYRMFSGAWGNWGFGQACDLSRPYTKIWMSTTVIEYGLQDDYNRQW